MGKLKYHSKGIGKNMEIQKQRRKPLPIGLMKNDKIDRVGIQRGSDSTDKIDGGDIRLSKNVGG